MHGTHLRSTEWFRSPVSLPRHETRACISRIFLPFPRFLSEADTIRSAVRKLGGTPVLAEDQDAGSVVDAADSDVVQASVDAQGDGSGLVDAVGADSVVVVDTGCWVGLGSRCLDRGRGGAVR